MDIENKVSNTSIGGKYVGGNDFSRSLILPDNPDYKSFLFDQGVVERFSRNASKYISHLAEDIVLVNSDIATPDDFGLYDESLPQKFENMKCSDSYTKEFNESMEFFPNVHQILNSDIIPRGNTTLKALFSLIKKIYSIVLDKYDDGYKIHSTIIGLLIVEEIDPVYHLSLEILVFYTVYSCGIFNEKK